MPISPINLLSDDRTYNSFDSSTPITALSDVGGGGNAPKPNPVIPVTNVDIVKVQNTVKPQERSKFLKMTTNFRNLKYSGDQPQNGTSPQPLVRTTLSSNFNGENTSNYTVDKSLNGVALFASIDQQRINQFLKTNVKGKNFSNKQNDLYFLNPKMEVGTNFVMSEGDVKSLLQGVLPQSRLAGGVEFTRFYNDNKNLLQQVGVQGTGLHFDEPGAQPVIPFQNKYEYVVRNKETDSNRLVLLFNSKIETNSFVRLNTLSTTGLADLNKLGLSRSQNKIFEYVGGPGSSDSNPMTITGRYDYTTDWKSFSNYSKDLTYSPSGDKLSNLLPRKGKAKAVTNTGVTNILFFDKQKNEQSNATLEDVQVVSLKRGTFPGDIITALNTPSPFNSTNLNHSLNHKSYVTSSFAKNNDDLPIINRSNVLSYDDIVKTAREAGSPPMIMPDFRADLLNIASTPGYDTYNNLGVKNLIGDPGNPLINRADYSTVGYSTSEPGKNLGFNNLGVDALNNLEVGNDGSKSDLIKCLITAIETQETSDNRAVPMTFRAFVTNFSDNINANYDTHQYVGRGENFYTYKNSERKVSFQLAIAVQSRAEMKPLYRKINYLISQLYPAYSGFLSGKGNGFMRAPLVKMTIGDYLVDQPGFLTAINISIPNESPWEIVNDKERDKDVYQLPHYLTMNINFTPIHNFVAKRSHQSDAGGQTYSITPFITPNSKDNKFGIGQ